MCTSQIIKNAHISDWLELERKDFFLLLHILKGNQRSVFCFITVCYQQSHINWMSSVYSFCHWLATRIRNSRLLSQTILTPRGSCLTARSTPQAGKDAVFVITEMETRKGYIDTATGNTVTTATTITVTSARPAMTPAISTAATCF